MKQFATLVLLAITFSSMAQLPKGLTPYEESILESYFAQLHNQNRAGITAPPQGSHIRTAAEWEEVQALVITWTNQFNSIPKVKLLMQRKKSVWFLFRVQIQIR